MNFHALMAPSPAKLWPLLTQVIQEQAKGKSQFHLAIPGGSTPEQFFQFWATAQGNELPWENLHFWWTDERIVPPYDPRSNFGMTQRTLFAPRQISPSNIHRVMGELSAVQAAINYGYELSSKIPLAQNIPQFDHLLLGVGPDGHVASLFPGQNPGLVHPLAVTAEFQGIERVSLSQDIILHAQRISFLVTGKSKQNVLKQIHQPQNSVDLQLPASQIFHARPDSLWVLDQDAAEVLL